MNFIKGFFCYLKGIIFFLSKPKLWKYAILPTIICLISYTGIFHFGKLFYKKFYLVKILPKLMKSTPAVPKWIFNSMTICILFLVGIIVFIAINLLSSPAQRLLSRKTEETLKGEVIYGKKKKGIIRKLLDMIRSLSYFIFMCIIIVFLNFIPVIGQIIALLIICKLTALKYLDFVFERRQLTYKEKKELTKQHIWLVRGFGLGCFIFFILPPFTILKFPVSAAIFAIPISILSGTEFALKYLELKENTN